MGLSSFCHATRPDFFERIFLFLPDQNFTVNTTTFIDKEILIPKALCDIKFTVRLNEYELFNCLHLVAAHDSSEVLRALLENAQCLNLVYEESKFGGTPLQHGIVRGSENICNLLLDHGANPAKMEKESRCHGLHVCGKFKGNEVLKIAARLLS